MLLASKHTRSACCFIGVLAILTLTACSPQQAEQNTQRAAEARENEAPAIPVEWSAESACSTCHDKQAESQTDSACLASKHASQTCMQCHTDASALASVHADARADSKMPSTLKATAVDDEAVCQSCHAHEDVAEKSQASTVLTDENGTVVNPHDLPEGDQHAEVTCTSCHKVHSSTGVEKTAQRACTSCHHTNVYESNTCHAA